MIDFPKFIKNYQNVFKENLKAWQIDALHFLIKNINRDLGSELINNIEQAAYILATIKHETANTYRPIIEYGKGMGRPYGKKDPVTGQTYYGRGYVQLTWKSNYEKLGKLLNLDLVNNPDLALDPETAYKILIIGLDEGLYGKDIDNCISNKLVDFILARKTVNSLDKAELIAGYAHQFLDVLKDSE